MGVGEMALTLFMSGCVQGNESSLWVIVRCYISEGE